MKLTTVVCIGNSKGKHKDLSLPPGDILIHTGGYSKITVPEGVQVSYVGLKSDPPASLISWMAGLPYKEKLVIPDYSDLFYINDIVGYKKQFTDNNIKVGILECLSVGGLGVGCFNYELASKFALNVRPSILQFKRSLFNNNVVPYGLDILVTKMPYNFYNAATHHTANLFKVIYERVPKICLFNGPETDNNLPMTVLDTTFYNTNVWYQGKQVPEIVQFNIVEK